ncbi:MAG: hypothetical protein IT167_29785 [Bryobacterales bacterium]|nr:hypothetical protein [Bryobacterales bacterium]
MRSFLLFFLSLPLLHGQPADKDIVLQAMRDELARSRSLRVIGDPPYFIEYTLDDAEMYGASANLGALVQERVNRIRNPRVRIRVGDMKLDNSNHIYSDVYRGSRYDPGQFAIDNNYEVLRMGFWLATDRTYKQALEALARKRASLKNVTETRQLPDFSPAPPVTLLLPVERKTIDSAVWRNRVKNLSAVFASYPKILTSEAETSISQTITYLANNEGSEIRYPDNLATIRIKASALASDGSTVRDHAMFFSVNLGRLPEEDQLKKATLAVAQNVTAMASAPVLESYSGPVLFEGAAGAQLFAELLVRNFSYFRRPVTDPDRPLNLPSGELEGRLGSRILPDWIDILDDPTQKEWRGIPLQGSYLVDMEGVVPKPVQMVEKGVLKAYYTTRQPIEGFPASNGHARLPGFLGNNTALAGNVFVKAGQTSSTAQLRERILEMGKQRHKPFVILVRKMDFPSSAGFEELRRLGGGRQGQTISIPLLVYKLFPDGKEELVRGVRFRGLDTRGLKDILAASDELFAFHYLENRAPFAHMDAGGYVAGTTVVAPELLFEDVELEKIPGELPKLPLVPPPPLTN